MSYQYSYGPGGGGQRPPAYGGGSSAGSHASYASSAPGQPPPPHQSGYGGGGYAAPPNAPPPGSHYGATPSPGYGGGGGGGGGGGSYGHGHGHGHPGAASGPQPHSTYGGSRPQAFTSRSGPPPGADPQLWQWFVSVDRDGSGQINPTELQQALVNGDWTPFELDTVKLLMTIFDTDRSGSITYNEFVGLWKYIQDWQGVFRHFDADRSGSIDQNELARALSNFGYNLTPHLLHIVLQKFVPNVSGTATNHRGITFDRFVRCCVVIKTLTDSFARKDVHRTGQITLSYDEFLELCLAAP